MISQEISIMGNLLFALGIGASQKAAKSKEAKPARRLHPVIGIIAGVLIALLIVVGLFILVAANG
jgi:hypothetical protein